MSAAVVDLVSEDAATLSGHKRPNPAVAEAAKLIATQSTKFMWLDTSQEAVHLLAAAGTFTCRVCIKAKQIVGILGCLDGHYTPNLVREYLSYVSRWASIPEAQRRLGVKYWALSEVQALYPALSVIGDWYGQLQPSSVAAERVFGVMRLMEGARLAAMKGDNFRRELMFAVNSRVMQDLTDRAFAAMKKT